MSECKRQPEMSIEGIYSDRLLETRQAQFGGGIDTLRPGWQVHGEIGLHWGLENVSGYDFLWDSSVSIGHAWGCKDPEEERLLIQELPERSCCLGEYEVIALGRREERSWAE